MKSDQKRTLPQVTLGPAASLGAAILLTGAVTLLALWLQPNALREVLSVFRRAPLLIVLNALPVGLLILAASFLLRNVFWGAAAVNLLVCALSVGNRIKLEVRDEPVFPRDLGLLKEVGSAMGTYDIRFPWAAVAVFAGFSLALAVLGVFLRCRPLSPKPRRDLLLRGAGALGSAGVLIALIFTVYASNGLYNSFPVSNAYYVPSVFNELGFPYCFTHHFTTYTVDRPDGFSRAEAEEWERDEAVPDSGPPVSVVMVMNEAFSDLTDEEMFTYAAEDDPLPNLHALRADPNCISGHVVVPGFAGGTANTEFDVLTGMQTNALSATTTSALRAVNRNVDSLFRLYGQDGYRTSFLHPGDAWFYNRENVFRFFGAEEIEFAEDMKDLEYKGRWVTDDYLAGLIEEKYEEAAAAGVPLCQYTTTIQNHMSYTPDKYGADYDYPPVQTSAALSDQARTLLSVYIEGARDADAMLGRLWRYFSAVDRPVVLAFWGDHLPYLGDNQLAYRELGLDIGQPGEGGQLSLASYETPYVIWANDAAAKVLNWEAAAQALDLPQGGTISACYLGATVAELTGRSGGSPWFRYLAELRRELPVIQKEYCVTASGETAAMDSLEQSQRDLISKLRRWSYYKLKYQDVE